MAKAMIDLKERRKWKTGDKAVKGNNVMNRQHSQGVRFRRSGMGRQVSRLRCIAAAEAVTRAKEIADEAAHRCEFRRVEEAKQAVEILKQRAMLGKSRSRDAP
jgi:predicted acetyltransferase